MFGRNLDTAQQQFLETLATTRGGALLNSLSDAQQECVIMAKNKKQKTKLILTLEYEVANDGDFKITSSIEKKIPNKKSITEYVYTNDSGIVFRNDPRQATMFEAKIISEEPADQIKSEDQ